MQFEGQSILVGALLFVGMIILAELSARRARAEAGPEASTGGGVVESSLFALLGLLLAFSFTGASSRLDHRRDLVVSEANALGTAALRLDLLPDPTLARQAMSGYIQTRLDYGAALSSQGDLAKAWKTTQLAQEELWKTVLISADSTKVDQVEVLVLPPINEAFDLASERHVMTQVHLPWPVDALLAILSLLCAWIGGRALHSKAWPAVLIRCSLALVVSLTLLLVKDLDHPRLGFIRVDSSDQLLREVKDSLD